MPSNPLASPASAKKHGGGKVVEKTPIKPTEKINEKAGEKAKNVSHVPCKFYRQSMCQAGDKCPFSHEMNSDTQAVCKYFQKGNCKFGSKCALAHITPDGRQVNKRIGKENRRKDRHRDEMKKLERSPKDNADEPSSPSLGHGNSASMQQAPSMISATDTGSPMFSPISDQSSSATRTSGFSTIGEQSSDQSVEMASHILSRYSGVGNASPLSHSQPKSLAMRAFSSNFSRRESSGRLLGGHFTAFAEGSAIADDDDEIFGRSEGIGLNYSLSKENDGEDSEEEEEGYREQLVPSALQDLLTPLERERRNSRNSHQRKTARVNSSPAPSTIPVGTNGRRSSACSEPAGSAPQGVLWGPRKNSVTTPFYRIGPFGSPPLSNSTLTSLQSPIPMPASSASLPQSSHSFPIPQTAGSLSIGANTKIADSPINSSFTSASSPIKSPTSRLSGSPLTYGTAGGLYRPFQQYNHAVPTEKF